jgi:hypothetical protein
MITVLQWRTCKEPRSVMRFPHMIAPLTGTATTPRPKVIVRELPPAMATAPVRKGSLALRTTVPPALAKTEQPPRPRRRSTLRKRRMLLLSPMLSRLLRS